MGRIQQPFATSREGPLRQRNQNRKMRYVRNRPKENPTRSQQAAQRAQSSKRVAEMLDDVGGDDRIEVMGKQITLEQLRDVSNDDLIAVGAGIRGPFGVDLNTNDSTAAVRTQGGREGSVATANFQDKSPLGYPPQELPPGRLGGGAAPRSVSIPVLALIRAALDK